VHDVAPDGHTTQYPLYTSAYPDIQEVAVNPKLVHSFIPTDLHI